MRDTLKNPVRPGCPGPRSKHGNGLMDSLNPAEVPTGTVTGLADLAVSAPVARQLR
jgi:hypothetical protein